MATNLERQTSSVDYFSLSRRKSEINQLPSSSSVTWDQSPLCDPTPQSPSSDESLAVSPVSPYTLSYSRSGYALPSQQGIEQKDRISLFNNSSFEDWMGGDSADNALYSSIKPDYLNIKLEATSPIMEALELSGGLGMAAMMSSGLDDASVTFQDSITEEPLFQAPKDVQLQPKNDLLSNQLPWSQSLPRYGLQHPPAAYPSQIQSDTPKLKSINMPTTSIPMSKPAQQPETRRKRKSTSSAMSNSSPASSNSPTRRQSAPIKKTAHNMIEKRYRTNLNDKIAALRDSIPSLRLTEKKDFDSESIVQENLGSLEAAQKLNKATILSKATEYIAHLEKRNTYLSKECQSLQDRINAFEILFMSPSGPARTSLSQQNLRKAK